MNLFKKEDQDSRGTAEEPEKKEPKNERLEAELEKLKAEISIGNELRKATTQRISGLEEQLGELRGILSEKERQIREISLKSSKASELVEQTHPEKMMLLQEKQNARIEILSGRVTSYHKISDNIIKDLKEIRQKIGLFKGVSQIIKLNEEVKDNLNLMDKTKLMMERHAEKAEKMLIKMDKKYAEFIRYKKINEDMKQEFNEMLKQLDSLGIERPRKKENILKRLFKKKNKEETDREIEAEIQKAKEIPKPITK